MTEIKQSLLEAKEYFRLVFVGGASGVGKTTLLHAVPNIQPLNTGSLFRDRMALASRDDVRKGDWAEYEEEVANDLLAMVIKSFTTSNLSVVDTHFAARIHNREYRIGLQRKLIYTLSKNIFSYSEYAGKLVYAIIVLIDCDVHMLLHRRRTDKNRNRELVPSDCFNDLRENRVLSRQYFSELLRAKNRIDSPRDHLVQYLVVENHDLKAATEMLHTIVSG